MGTRGQTPLKHAELVQLFTIRPRQWMLLTRPRALTAAKDLCKAIRRGNIPAYRLPGRFETRIRTTVEGPEVWARYTPAA